VNDGGPLADDPDLRLRMQIAAQYDAPAFVRRARHVADEYEALLARCRRQRADWLTGVRLHLGSVRAGAGSWDVLRPLLADTAQVAALEQLHAEAGDPEHAMTGPTGRRGLRRALRDLNHSIERFNGRWTAFLRAFDLSAINAARDGYNRHYLLEKECAVGPSRLHARTFRPLDPLTADDLLVALPPLPVPRLAD
jgi:hypothetical protein